MKHRAWEAEGHYTVAFSQHKMRPLSLISLFVSFALASAQAYYQQDTQIRISGDMNGQVEAPKPILFDTLTIQPSASIFFAYARETRVGELFKRKEARITVFAPTNKAVMALARKPHQGTTPVDDTVISESEFESISKENVERWVSAHIVPQFIEHLSPTSQFEALLEGIVISVSEAPDYNETKDTKPEWERILLNENVTVATKHEASNGILYLIDGAFYG